MSDEAAFLRAIQANPTDATAKDGRRGDRVESERIRKIRDHITDDLGYPRSAARSFDPDPEVPAYSVAGIGDSLLSDAIKCFVVEMNAEARELLAKSDRWLSVALERARAGEPVSFVAGSYSDLVLCRRLADLPPDPVDLTRSAETIKTGLDSQSRSASRQIWGYALPRLLLAGAAQYVISEFAHTYPRYTLPRRPTPAGMAFALARHRTHTPLVSDSELVEARDRFLAIQIPTLIDRGAYEDCAVWALLFGEGTNRPAGDVVRETFVRFA